MRNAFIIGLIAGLTGMLLFAYSAPFLAQDRVRAETRVQTNGGRLEVFEVRTATDTMSLVPGSGGGADVIPAGSAWYPELAPFRDSAAVYRLRNESGTVIGVASRVRAMRNDDDVEWILHIPARGTMALTGIGVDIAELGALEVGLGEFAGLRGEWRAELGEDGSTWTISTNVRAVTASDSGTAENTS